MMTWLLSLAAAVAVSPEAQLRLGPDTRVAVGADGMLQTGDTWRITPTGAAGTALFYVPSSETTADELATQVQDLAASATVYVPKTSGDTETQMAQVLAAFTDVEAVRGTSPLALVGAGDGADLLTTLLDQRKGRWGKTLAAAVLVNANRPSSGGLMTCPASESTHCVLRESSLATADIAADLKTRFSAFPASMSSHLEQRAPEDPITLPAEGRDSLPAPLPAEEFTPTKDSATEERHDALKKKATSSAAVQPVGVPNMGLAQTHAPVGHVAMACAKVVTSSAGLAAKTHKPGSDAAMSVPGVDGIWEPADNNNLQWLEWSWTEQMELRYLQAASVASGVTEFKLQYKAQDGVWTWYKKSEDDAKAFSEFTMRAESPKMELIGLEPPVQTAALRFWPTKWEDQIALKADILGCPESAVQAANLDLSLTKSQLFPTIFDNPRALHIEFRGEISKALRCSPDQIQIMSLENNPAGGSRVSIHILPKDKNPSPAVLMSELDPITADPNSGLSKFLTSVEEAVGKVQLHTAHYSCEQVDCNGFGTCHGGECFCLEGHSGTTCKDTYDETSPTLNEKGETIDPETGEIVETDEKDTSIVDDLEPIGLAASGEVPPTGESKVKVSEEQLDASVDELAEKAQDDALEDEPGVSGTVKRHMIVVGLIGLAALIMAGCLINASEGKNKGEGLLAEADGEDSNPRVQERE